MVDTDNSGATSNNTASNTTASTNGGLQIKKDIKYFDGASGYLIYPSSVTAAGTTGKKVPAIMVIHE